MKENVILNKFNNICKYKFNNNNYKLKFYYSLFQKNLFLELLKTYFN